MAATNPMPTTSTPSMPMMGMNPMMMGMGMPMNPMMMGMGMPMNPMMGMGMPMNPMMGMGMNPMMGMGMGMPMMMPMMMRQMAPMMARMTCEMGKDGMVCKMMPMEGQDMAMLKECCDAMNAMMAMGAPVTMMCNGMPMMMGTAR
ncbi:hypothetical protein JY651_04335 [Pyxidicoccus parkwayensis]|uniref:Uncharacterized protein n=2 Tax=Pyxidicoccus parkwayensis TaxID=2813578 RepID=A0ABX7PC17_9BACT|nr:hypothetical protein JY651_04335 [Pyxidicoccus parkwaysis]